MTLLGETTSPQLANAVTQKGPFTLLIPLGSTEQHGPHLPLDTDTRIAVAVAQGIAKKWPQRSARLVVADPICISAADEHRGFAGTLSVGTKVLSEMLVEIVCNAGPEFERIVVINGHGGNAYALRAATDTCSARQRPLEVWSLRLDNADAHAGRVETSLMLAIAPQLVRLDLAQPGATEPLTELLPKLMEGGVGAVSANGVLGDPRGATAAAGTRLLADLIDDAVKQLTHPQRRTDNQTQPEPFASDQTKKAR